MIPLDFRLIQTGTKEYEEMICLRMKVLLLPIGMPRSYINEKKEAQDLLIGGYEDDRLVGCCILTKVDEGTVQLRQMAVDTDYQRKGIGASLLSFAETVAVQSGYAVLMMHARDMVIPFYERCGYVIDGQRFVEVGIPHHKMKKQLVAQKI